MSIANSTGRYFFVLLHEKHFALMLQDEASAKLNAWRNDSWQRIESSNHLHEVLVDSNSELEKEDEPLTVFLLHDHATTKELSVLLRDGTGLNASHWNILQWEDIFDSLGGVFEYSLPDLEHMYDPISALIGTQPKKFLSSPESVVNVVSGFADESPLSLPSQEHLLTFLPALYQHVFTVLNGADLANLIGRIEPFVIPSPYPELSRDVLRAKQRAFLALPQVQQKAIVRFAQKASTPLHPRQEMFEIILTLVE